MKKYILITGASSGIGYEMARQLALKKHNLILVARNEETLKALVNELGVNGISLHYFVKDQCSSESAIRLYEEIIQEKLEVTALINNAGVGLYGKFIETDLKQELDMMELNMNSVVILTKLFAKDMVAKGSGRIMNVASLLSFLPFPYYSVYSATKSFVLAFTETVAAELEHTGVIVTALCPGPVDTPFNTKAMWTTNAYQANKPMSPELVAAKGIELLLNGKGKKIVGFNNWFISNLPRITSDKIMMAIKKKLASQKN